MYVMAKINFGGVEEKVITRDEFTMARAKEVLKNEVIAIIGYGVQGPAQALNFRDNNFNVIVGQRQDSPTWQKAINDKWQPNVNLFGIEEAVAKATIVCYLLSDAAQIAVWPKISNKISAGKTLCFSHGFGITYASKTGIIPDKGVNVVLVAPKGSGASVRRNFLEGRGINSSYAVHQDANGKAHDIVCALGVGMGSGYLFETTFAKEATSDLVGERGALMGAIAGLMEAQYNVLRKNGHSPSEAFNETVEEATQSLIPLVGENGMDWMFANCSTTAQRGALDWSHKFKKAVEPVFEELYNSVKTGVEADISIKSNSQSDYREKLQAELDAIKNSEMWQAGAQVRKLRPERNKK
jgi:ketol-acid reductoisomerase